MFSSVIVPLALAASALANVYVCNRIPKSTTTIDSLKQITNPVGSTTLTAGQPANVTWMDDGKTPTLAQFGNASVGVFVGNALQQVRTANGDVPAQTPHIVSRHSSRQLLILSTYRPCRLSRLRQMVPSDLTGTNSEASRRRFFFLP